MCDYVVFPAQALQLKGRAEFYSGTLIMELRLVVNLILLKIQPNSKQKKNPTISTFSWKYSYMTT